MNWKSVRVRVKFIVATSAAWNWPSIPAPGDCPWRRCLGKSQTKTAARPADPASIAFLVHLYIPKKRTDVRRHALEALISSLLDAFCSY
jgi:hypothetical protein